MTKVHYDLRPVDNENIINTRNRIRLGAVLILFGVVLYLNIQSGFKQAHASWTHLLHIILQPYLIFVTIADNSSMAFVGSVSSAVACAVDTSVILLNFIAISRCFGEPTASCFDRLYENGTWFVLAGWMLLFDIVQVTQLFNLKTQLARKDLIERKNIAMHKLEKDVPTWNSVKVYSNKTRLMNLQLIVFDLTYNITMISLLTKMPMLFIGMFHVFIDLYSYFVTNNSSESATYEIIRVIFVISFICNVIILVLMVQMEIDTIGMILNLMITITYVLTDMIQIFYTSRVIDTVANYKKFKSNL